MSSAVFSTLRPTRTLTSLRNPQRAWRLSMSAPEKTGTNTARFHVNGHIINQTLMPR